MYTSFESKHSPGSNFEENGVVDQTVKKEIHKRPLESLFLPSESEEFAQIGTHERNDTTETTITTAEE